jgi:hypothetical protein
MELNKIHLFTPIEDKVFKFYVCEKMNELKHEKSVLSPNENIFQQSRYNLTSDELKIFFYKFYPTILNMDNEYFKITKENSCKFITTHLIDAHKYNINFEKNKKVIESLVMPEYQSSTFIAGGTFTKYDENSYIKRKFKHVFKRLKKQQDIDIYICIDSAVKNSKNKDKQYILSTINYWLVKNVQPKCKTFRNFYCDSQEDGTDMKYDDIYKFKINSNWYNIIITSINILDTLKSFDYNACKICYVYSNNCVYIHSSLTNHICSNVFNNDKVINFNIPELSNENFETFLYNPLFMQNNVIQCINNMFRIIKYCAKNFLTEENIKVIEENEKTFKKYVKLFKYKLNLGIMDKDYSY